MPSALARTRAPGAGSPCDRQARHRQRRANERCPRAGNHELAPHQNLRKLSLRIWNHGARLRRPVLRTRSAFGIRECLAERECEGLRARGGFIVDETWSGAKLTSATIV